MKKLFTFLTLICLTAFVSAQSIEDKLVNRLVEYASIYTQSEYDVDEVPSSKCQFGLAVVLADELEMLGAQDVKIDEHAYVYATIKGNMPNAPTLFLSAHLDTSPDGDLKGKTPIPVVHRYKGGNLQISEKLTLLEDRNEFLPAAVGGKVITSDGTTLLGGDDKAGMSVVMTIAETLLKSPNIPHGDVRIIFTPDEEIGNSTKYLTKEKIAADFGLVVDSHGFGRIVVENFNATDFTFTVKTASAGHPGYSSNVPPLNIATNFISQFPEALASYNSSGKDGYLSYYKTKAVSSNEYVVYGRIRSFELNEMKLYKKMLLSWAQETAKQYDLDCVTIINGERNGNSDSIANVTLNMKDSYFNSKEVLKNYPTNYKLIEQAYKMAGVKMRAESGRGGSDACDITYMGIPTYNMFAGSHNEHSNDEWVSSKQMLASYNVALNYIKLMAEHSREEMLNDSLDKRNKKVSRDINIDIDKIFKNINDQYNTYPFSNIK
ncbi:MAG: tripeptide aminopeptidase PepT [Elusimicrobiaceae bacterium]|nr:tripeptide aminopeptidase PepT [Elusimicrobiaceae bacterium]